MGASDLELLLIGEDIDTAQRELFALVDRHLSAAQCACENARASLAWVEGLVERARAAAFDVPHQSTRLALLVQVSALDTQIEAVRPTIEALP